jgi:putative DNA primase/helicase
MRTTAEIATLHAAALRQPGAVQRARGVKFQCPGCRDDGHDQHQDNACLFDDGGFGCAVDTTHWRAIGAVLGAGPRHGSPGAPPAPDPIGNGHGGVQAPQAIIVPASTITPETIEWLWPGRVAVGALTNVVGAPDQGKSLLYVDITARLTTGAAMPPAARRADPRVAADVLILTHEDALATTLVPRLLIAGADLSRVAFLQMIRDAEGRQSIVTLERDVEVLRAALAATPVRLLIIDGLAGYLGTAKTHVDADVRRVLTPFVAMLAATRVAGLSVMHPPKSVANLAYFAGGSVAFTGLPRVVLGVGQDPNDESPTPRRLVMKLKGNLYGHVPTLAYRIAAETPASVPWLEWAPEPVEADVADVFTPDRETSEERHTRRDCEAWLTAYLGATSKPAREVERAAQAAGFKPHTLRRARERTCDAVYDGKAREWLWFQRGAR